MLPTKLQLIYDYIHENETINTTNNQSTISYDQFTKYLTHLKLVNQASIPNNHLTVPNNQNNYNSEFIHHIFSTYKQTSQFKHGDTCSEGEYWLKLLSKANNGLAISTEKFIQFLTKCNIESMTRSPVRVK